MKKTLWIVIVMAFLLSACFRPYQSQMVKTPVQMPAYRLVSADGQVEYGVVYISKVKDTCVIVQTNESVIDKSCVNLVLRENDFEIPVNQELFPVKTWLSSEGIRKGYEYLIEIGRGLDCYITVGVDVDIECLKH